MYYLLVFTFAVCCASSVYEVEFVEHLHQEHKIRKRETGTTPSTKTVTDNHDYYTSKVVSDPDGMYWNELEGHTRHNLSNDKHFRYATISLSFNFTFYGHLIDTFDITTGGFLYMSSFHHPNPKVIVTRYIAPLMANFDTIGSDSDILYRDDGDSCVIEWRNVQLNDHPEKGNYTFQTTLFENGTILFSYKSIPETDIPDWFWHVKVGISDSYYHDIYGWRFIIRYHTIQKNVTDLTDNMAIILDPLPTCNTASSCTECTELKSGFNCSWCPSVSRCSDGIDWNRQEWIDADCKCEAFSSSDMCTTTGNKEGQTTQKDSNKTLQTVIPIVVVCSVLLILVGFWVVYARRHPNTSSGRWLIENRPSRIKEKISDSFSNINFSRESKTGDKVRIP